MTQTLNSTDSDRLNLLKSEIQALSETFIYQFDGNTQIQYDAFKIKYECKELLELQESLLSILRDLTKIQEKVEEINGLAE